MHRFVVLPGVHVARDRARDRHVDHLVARARSSSFHTPLSPCSAASSPNMPRRERERMAAAVVVRAGGERRVAAAGQQRARPCSAVDARLVAEHQHEHVGARVDGAQRRGDRRRAALAEPSFSTTSTPLRSTARADVIGAAAEHAQQLSKSQARAVAEHVVEQRARPVRQQLLGLPEPLGAARREHEARDERLSVRRHHPPARSAYVSRQPSQQKYTRPPAASRCGVASVTTTSIPQTGSVADAALTATGATRALGGAVLGDQLGQDRDRDLSRASAHRCPARRACGAVAQLVGHVERRANRGPAHPAGDERDVRNAGAAAPRRAPPPRPSPCEATTPPRRWTRARLDRRRPRRDVVAGRPGDLLQARARSASSPTTTSARRRQLRLEEDLERAAAQARVVRDDDVPSGRVGSSPRRARDQPQQHRLARSPAPAARAGAPTTARRRRRRSPRSSRRRARRRCRPARTLVGWRRAHDGRGDERHALGRAAARLGWASSPLIIAWPPCPCIASHTRDGVHGMSMCRTPYGPARRRSH